MNVTANQNVSTRYLTAAPVVRSFEVAKGTQTVTLGAISNRAYTSNSSKTFSLSGSSSAGLTPVYTVVSGPATISGGSLTVTGTGEITVSASHPGNAGYLPAAAVSRSFTVTPNTVHQITIRGEQGEYYFDGYSVPFGYMNYGYPVVKWFTFANRTSRPLSNLEYVLSGTGAANYEFVEAPAEIPANGSISVGVRFTSLERGSRTAQLVIRDKTQDADSFALSLNGTGAVSCAPFSGLNARVFSAFAVVSPSKVGLARPRVV